MITPRSNTRMSSVLTFLISPRFPDPGTLMVFTATGHPLYAPHLISPNPPKASISSRTSSSSVIKMRPGSSAQRSVSLLNVVRKVFLSAGLRLYPARP